MGWLWQPCVCPRITYADSTRIKDLEQQSGNQWVKCQRKLLNCVTSESLQPLEIRNDLVSSWTPLPFFAPPTIPTAPPLAFKTVPSLILSPIQVPHLDNGIFFSTDKFNFMKVKTGCGFSQDKWYVFQDWTSIKRFRRSTDYYDQVDETKKKSSSSTKKTSSTDDDYYNNFESESEDKEEQETTGLKQCVHLLGIGVWSTVSQCSNMSVFTGVINKWFLYFFHCNCVVGIL